MPRCDYGLLVLYVTETVETDVYGHIIPPNERVAQCIYLESYKERKDGTLYYFEKKKSALISAYCMASICPADDFRDVIRQKKVEKMLFISNDMHVSLTEYMRDEL